VKLTYLTTDFLNARYLNFVHMVVVMVIESLGIWLRLLNYFTFSSPNVIYNFNTCEDISIRKKTSFGIHRPLICEYLVTGYAAVVMDFGVHKLNSASILLFILSKTEKFRVEKKMDLATLWVRWLCLLFT
jgi:hypothetical protein